MRLRSSGSRLRSKCHPPNSIARPNEAGVLFFSIPFDMGWHFEVNGKVREPVMVNFGFLALELEAGVWSTLRYSQKYIIGVF